MIPISEVRKRLVQRIEQAKRSSVERRAGLASAEQDYERFLSHMAIPVLSMVQSVLQAEGHRFSVSTPAGRVRLVPDGPRDDGIEIALETNAHPPVVIGRATYTRGRRVATIERPLRDDTSIAELDDEDVLAFVLAEIGPFVDRS